MELQALNLENDVMEFDAGSGKEEETEAVTSLDLEQQYQYDCYNYNNYSNSNDFLTRNSLPSPSSFPSSTGNANWIGSPNPYHEPYEGMPFDSEQAARIFYNSYARRIGFSTRVSAYQRSRCDGSIICRQIVCSREGFRREGSENRSKRQRSVTRVGCKAQMTVKKQTPGNWAVTKLVKEHNHELVPLDKVHCLRSHRHVSGSARSLIDTLQAAGMGPSGVMSVLIKESGGINNVGFTKVDCQNYMSSTRQRTLGNGTEYIFDYFRQMQAEDPGFFYAVQGNMQKNMGNIFWADAASRMNYKYFGDTVTLDTTYRTNRYRVPFAPFTGLNHHGQPVLLGCALLLNESESSFIWLIQTWLTAMSGQHPISITTDQDRFIKSAVAQVLPETRHRFCSRNIFREAQEKLSHVLHSYHTFEAEFHKCINVTETTDEFESCWKSLLERYSLRDNEWLQSMYSVRQQWVPVYLRDTFFGEIYISQSSDSINSYFDGYVNATTNIHILMKQCEKAIVNRQEMEVKADYDTLNTAPVLKTPSPMEKQVANIYTSKIFMKFQEELVETLANPANVIDDTGVEIVYQVAKFGENHKAHFIRFNVFEKKASCSCQMFEFSGIVCRHILAVFKVVNILTLPCHYILRRWTRNARSEQGLDEHSLGLSDSCNETFASRYESLSQQAIKHVEEGGDSIHICNVALEALHEAAKKVAAMKQDVPVVSPSTLVRKSNPEVNMNKNQIDYTQSFSVEQDKRIQELTSEIENASQRCEAYRSKLLAVLKDLEEQKLKISVKVQNVRFNLNTWSSS